MLRRFGVKAAIGACFVLILPTLAAAQGVITGVVRDTSGAVLPGVSVEAASPALIEKIRTAVTDGAGQYRIIDLRPGTYSVTFTLPGFSTVKRDGVELSGTATVSINAEMRVGGVEETITVTGEAPVVDVQGVTQQRSVTREVLDTVPAGRTVHNMAALIPGMTVSATGFASGQDVGGSTQGGLQQAAIHGGRTGDQRVMMDGLPLNTAQGNLSGFISNIGSTQEFTIDTSGVSAEDNSGGVRMNIVPREGGNNFSGTFFITGATGGMQSTNFDDDLVARGFAIPNPPKSLKMTRDINPAGGGPIFRDRLWFYAAGSWSRIQNRVAVYPNLNAGNPNAWLYAPDTNAGEDAGSVYDVYLRGVNTRVTWQANQKNKFAFFFDDQVRCICPDAQPTFSPEAQRDSKYPDQGFMSFTWTSPVTNKLLLDAAVLHRIERWGDFAQEGTDESLIPVNDNVLGLTYRGRSNYSFNRNANTNIRASASFVTGSHAFKAGFQNMWAKHNPRSTANTNNLAYQFSNQVPNQITLYAFPLESDNRLTDFGMFVQDRWTLGKLTLSGGLRFDYLHTWFPSQSLGPAPLAPNRNISIDKTDWVSWKDITPRAGLAYDVFGNGRTAVKVTLNKYLGAQSASGTFGSGGNPLNRLANTTTRGWSDLDRDFTPDCEMLNPAANGECLAFQNSLFGQPVAQATVDPELMTGWGVRPGANWEFSTSVQQQILPRLGVDFGYFRRSYKNFLVTDNLAVAPSDYSPFSVVAPIDSRLPDGGGNTISGLYNINANRQGQVNNLLTLADNYGDYTERWHGVDVSANYRPGRGLTFQGGMSTGSTLIDNCEVRAELPELSVGTISPTSPYCHTETNWLTQVKGLASYTVPRIDVLVGASFQSIPGPQVSANNTYTSAQVAGSLGRPLVGATTVQVNLVEPGTEYGERTNQVDLRLAKILRFGRARTNLSADLFNAFNANPVTSHNNNFGPVGVWLRPNTVLPGRLIKLTAQFDF